jgi:hypothetical protein
MDSKWRHCTTSGTILCPDSRRSGFWPQTAFWEIKIPQLRKLDIETAFEDVLDSKKMATVDRLDGGFFLSEKRLVSGGANVRIRPQ